MGFLSFNFDLSRNEGSFKVSEVPDVSKVSRVSEVSEVAEVLKEPEAPKAPKAPRGLLKRRGLSRKEGSLGWWMKGEGGYRLRSCSWRRRRRFLVAN